MDKIIFKSFQLELAGLDEKKLDKGELTVCFATMGVWDKDGDMAMPGFYGKQQIVMLPAHDWSHVPLGKGMTREEGAKAVADIKMNLDIQAAKDWLSAIKFDLKEGTPVQEYSYGFKVLAGGSRSGEAHGRTGRLLVPREDGSPGAKIWEVSPVLVGAGEATHTMAAKGAGGQQFAEEAQAVLDAVDALLKRGESLAGLRAEAGRDIGTSNKERFAAIADSLQKSAQSMLTLIAPPVKEPTPVELEARKELVRMMKVRAGKA